MTKYRIIKKLDGRYYAQEREHESEDWGQVMDSNRYQIDEPIVSEHFDSASSWLATYRMDLTPDHVVEEWLID